MLYLPLRRAGSGDGRGKGSDSGSAIQVWSREEEDLREERDGRTGKKRICAGRGMDEPGRRGSVR
ncbi:MAG: hypothetical protein JST42_06050 [Bacteroidetes bacterium]|nr:hypothetical protein [Bacteroidota bacterium]